MQWPEPHREGWLNSCQLGAVTADWSAAWPAIPQLMRRGGTAANMGVQIIHSDWAAHGFRLPTHPEHG